MDEFISILSIVVSGGAAIIAIIATFVFYHFKNNKKDAQNRS